MPWLKQIPLRGAGLLPAFPLPVIRLSILPIKALLLTALSLAFLPSADSHSQEGAHFVDITQASGISFRNRAGSATKHYIVESQPAGVGFLDFDSDGRLDLVFTGGADTLDSTVLDDSTGKPPHTAGTALYHNQGDGTFVDLTEAAGLSLGGWNMGCAVGDYDNDGDPDLYITRWGTNVLYRNQGGKFTKMPAQSGAGDPGWSIGAAFGDYDNDGDLDLYVANYIEFVPHSPPYFDKWCTHNGIAAACGPAGFPAQADVLFSNNNGTFVPVSAPAGLGSQPYYGMSALWADLDQDADLDLYVANDGHPNHLFRNNSGRFSDEALAVGTAFSGTGKAQAGMGVACGDWNNDGHFDLFVTNFAQDYNTLYHNSGNGFFIDRSGGLGLSASSRPYMGWGTFFFDYDHDGLLDLFVANGHLMPAIDQAGAGLSYRQPNQLYRNTGRRFEDMGIKAGQGLAYAAVSRGAAYGDIDADGDLDIAVANLDDKQTLLRNDGVRGNWLQVRLQGTDSNRDAVGATIRAVSGKLVQHRQVLGGGSLQAHSDLGVHLGLGHHTHLDTLEILWPAGKSQTFTAVEANRIYYAVEGQDHLSLTKIPPENKSQNN
jgi:enediyne biosynthesis protein E4